MSDGDAVGEWKDLSGNGNDLTQTLELTNVALEKVYNTIINNGKILSSTNLNKKEIINFNLEIRGGINLIFFHKILNIFLIFFFLTNIYFLLFKKNVKTNI